MPTTICPNCRKPLHFSKYPSSPRSVCPICGNDFKAEFPELDNEPSSFSGQLSPSEAARLIAERKFAKPDAPPSPLTRAVRAARSTLMSPITTNLAAAVCVIGWVLTIWSPSTPAFLLNYACVLGAGAVLTSVVWRALRGRVIFTALAGLATVFLLLANAWWDQYDKKLQTLENGVSKDTQDTIGRFNPRWNWREETWYRGKGLHSARGPLSADSKRHGRWTLTYVDPPSAVDKWFWKGEEVKEEEWKARNK
jgi:hypothetical protein